MFFNRWIVWTMGLAWLFALGWGGVLKAATIETEESEDISDPSTPVPTEAAKGGEAGPAVSPGDAKGPERARISDQIGFFYFVQAGYLAETSSQVPLMGKVWGSTPENLNYSTPQKFYVELSSKAKVGVEDLLVVYRDQEEVREPHEGFIGLRVQNLAIVKVLEVQKQRCLVEVKSDFFPFEKGDRVKAYNDEIQRWKKAQLKKNLPMREIRCHVASGSPGRSFFNRTDFVILTAGEKSGVVEGQIFNLREKTDTGVLEESLHVPRATAQVFYTGPNYSVAQILTNSEPIQSGFEAWYKP